MITVINIKQTPGLEVLFNVLSFTYLYMFCCHYKISTFDFSFFTKYFDLNTFIDFFYVNEMT